MGPMEKDKGVNVQVLLRCRPGSEEELRMNVPQVITCFDARREVTVKQTNPATNKVYDRTFTFDKVFGPASRQQDLYQQAITPIVDEVLEGFNCTIFAYGQTGTGKTYTMEGLGTKQQDGEMPPDAGVIPRAVQQIFDCLERQQAEYNVKVTFLELYNEELTDLLAPDEAKIPEDKPKKPLALMEDSRGGGVLVRGLEEEMVNTAPEIYNLLERGSAKRRTAETLLNKQSSRSHSIFTITIHMKESTPDGEELIKCGKLNLVDLAGSENISRSGAREGRAREAGEINKSLLTLGRVITALVEHLGHIPYRDSKLTRLLRDSLGGRTKTCIIATVSPSVHCLEETLSTLDYAHRAKNIKNKPEVNQKTTKLVLIKDMAWEIERLKSDLYNQREKTGVYISKDRYSQEEAERKAMAERIEQLEEALDSSKKLVHEWTDKHDALQHHHEVLQAQHVRTEQHLADTQDQLAASEAALQDALASIKQKTFIIQQQKDAEERLVRHAAEQRQELAAVAAEHSTLHARLESKRAMEQANAEAAARMRSCVEQSVAALTETLHNTAASQHARVTAVDMQLLALLERRGEELALLKEKLQRLQKDLGGHASQLSGAVRSNASTAGATLEELERSDNRHYDAQEEDTAGAVQDCCRVLTGLQEDLEKQKQQMKVAADEHIQDSRANLERATLFADALMKDLEAVLLRFGSCHTALGSSQAAQDEQMGALASKFKAQLQQTQEQLLEGVKGMLERAGAQQESMVVSELDRLRKEAVESREIAQAHLSHLCSATGSARCHTESYRNEGRRVAAAVEVSVRERGGTFEELVHTSIHAARDAGSALHAFQTESEAMRKMHREAMQERVMKETRRASAFADDVEEKAKVLMQRADSGLAAAVAAATDAHGVDVAETAKSRAVLGEHSVAASAFARAHGESASFIAGRVDTFVAAEFKEDLAALPSMREIYVPSEQHAANLCSGVGATVLAGDDKENVAEMGKPLPRPVCRTNGGDWAAGPIQNLLAKK